MKVGFRDHALIKRQEEGTGKEAMADAAEDDEEMTEEQREMERDARKRWKDAGYFPGAFTMQAYQEKFIAEALDNVDDEWRLNDIAHTSNLTEKVS